MKIMYTRPEDNGVSIVVAAPKEQLERVLGPLTQEQYEAHVMERSTPENALRVRIITDADLPGDREFRNAWSDVTAEAKVDIDLVKAKNLKLAELRAARDVELLKLDKELMIALERGDNLEGVKQRKKALRDATEPLKALQVSGVNDEAVLNQIRSLSVLGSF